MPPPRFSAGFLTAQDGLLEDCHDSNAGNQLLELVVLAADTFLPYFSKELCGTTPLGGLQR